MKRKPATMTTLKNRPVVHEKQYRRCRQFTVRKIDETGMF